MMTECTIWRRISQLLIQRETWGRGLESPYEVQQCKNATLKRMGAKFALQAVTSFQHNTSCHPSEEEMAAPVSGAQHRAWHT